MTRHNEIIAISEFYNVPMRIATLRRDFIGDIELEDIIAWWLEKKAN